MCLIFVFVFCWFQHRVSLKTIYLMVLAVIETWRVEWDDKRNDNVAETTNAVQW